jgi:hypothetical protein
MSTGETKGDKDEELRSEANKPLDEDMMQRLSTLIMKECPPRWPVSAHAAVVRLQASRLGGLSHHTRPVWLVLHQLTLTMEPMERVRFVGEWWAFLEPQAPLPVERQLVGWIYQGAAPWGEEGYGDYLRAAESELRQRWEVEETTPPPLSPIADTTEEEDDAAALCALGMERPVLRRQ